MNLKPKLDKNHFKVNSAVLGENILSFCLVRLENLLKGSILKSKLVEWPDLNNSRNFFFGKYWLSFGLNFIKIFVKLLIDGILGLAQIFPDLLIDYNSQHSIKLGPNVAAPLVHLGSILQHFLAVTDWALNTTIICDLCK